MQCNERSVNINEDHTSVDRRTSVRFSNACLVFVPLGNWRAVEYSSTRLGVFRRLHMILNLCQRTHSLGNQVFLRLKRVLHRFTIVLYVFSRFRFCPPHLWKMSLPSLIKRVMKMYQ